MGSVAAPCSGGRRDRLRFMRWVIALSTLLLAAGCGENRSSSTVVPEQITVSTDRLTVEVHTAYPTNGCAKEPGGLRIDVADGVATVSASVENSTGAKRCTLECGQVRQTITLDEPLPDPVRFEYPSDANPGCGGISPLVSTTSTPPDTMPCPEVSAPKRNFDQSAVPTPLAESDSDGRDEFGRAVVEALEPMILGADAGIVVSTLRGTGWTVTVVDDTAATTTATPDLLWNRLIVSICNGRVNRDRIRLTPHDPQLARPNIQERGAPDRTCRYRAGVRRLRPNILIALCNAESVAVGRRTRRHAAMSKVTSGSSAQAAPGVVTSTCRRVLRSRRR